MLFLTFPVQKARAGAGDIVVIIGAGPVGMDVLACARAAGAYIIIADVMKNRLKIAKEMGADRAVCVAEEELLKVVREATDGRGADVVVETVGSTAARTVYQAVELTRARGTIIIMGTNPENRAELTPGAPPRASTTSPESSASVQSPVT